MNPTAFRHLSIPCLLAVSACTSSDTVADRDTRPDASTGAIAKTDASTGAIAKTSENTEQAPGSTFTIRKKVEHGRVEDHGGLRVIRLWGEPAQRGRAHAQLVGGEAIDLMRRELIARFSRQKSLLKRARSMLPVIVKYPKPYEAELRAMFGAIEEQDIDLTLPGFDRKLDVTDAMLVNAMDLVVQIGCSGFTVFGDQVEGGGVLTARNFDWPMTGTYLVKSCCLLVQHPHDGAAFAAVTWPGYIGAVTGVNEHGVSVFLHFGDSGGGLPRAGCHPTATAARRILQHADAASAFEVGEKMLKKTWPPRGYLTRVVGADPTSGHPMRIFECDGRGVTFREDHELCVVTNHFLSRDRETKSGDSFERLQDIRTCLTTNLTKSDKKVSVEEAWQALEHVQRSGKRFATQHSLVFRNDPWVFELALGDVRDDGHVGAAPGHGKRYPLTRGAVFPELGSGSKSPSSKSPGSKSPGSKPTDSKSPGSK